MTLPDLRLPDRLSRRLLAISPKRRQSQAISTSCKKQPPARRSLAISTSYNRPEMSTNCRRLPAMSTRCRSLSSIPLPAAN